VPLTDRDYMKPTGQPRRSRAPGPLDSFLMNPVMVIMALNILVFLVVTVTQQRGVSSLELRPAYISEQPWTIITAMFLHVSIWHIFSNMLALFFFGRIVYKLMGGWRFVAVYLAGGIAGNLLYLLIGPQNPALGASGAVYAIAGTLVVLMPKLRVSLWGIIPLPLWAFVIVFLGVLSLPPFAGANIAWQAHLGGLAVGLIGGFIFRRQMRHVIYRP
jgi:membrane associated rhomboid family serine protease